MTNFGSGIDFGGSGFGGGNLYQTTDNGSGVIFGKDINYNAIEQKPSVSFGLDGLVNIKRRWKVKAKYATQHYTKIRQSMPPFPESGELSNFKFLNYGVAAGGIKWSGTQARCIESSIEPLDREASWYMLSETYVGYFTDRLPQTTFKWTPNRLDVPIDQHPRWNEGKANGGGTVVPGAEGRFVHNKHWTENPNTGTIDNPVFPAFEIIQDENGKPVRFPDSDTRLSTIALYNGSSGTESGEAGGVTRLNPYRGIEAFPMATGTWTKTSFGPAMLGDTPVGDVLKYDASIDGFLDCAPLWKWSKPNIDFTAADGVSNGWVLSNGNAGAPSLNNLWLPAYQNMSFTYPDDPDDPPHQYCNWIKTQDDIELTWRGAVPLWQRTESWWFNARGWIEDIYKPLSMI